MQYDNTHAQKAASPFVFGQFGLWGILILSLLFSRPLQAQEKDGLPAPQDFFGFKAGADRQLFGYEALTTYLQELAAASPRLEMHRTGTSPLGRPIYIAFVSAAENIRQLDTLKAINRELALNANLPEAQRKAYVQRGRVFVLATLSMHANEVGPAQAGAAIIHELLTTDSAHIRQQLQNTVLMIVPSHNPDGMDMVVNHYKKYKGTRYEGARLPRVYHKYVGHDNNRDFVTLTQQDNRAVAAIYNKEWFPQVMVEKHQMGNRGPRYYVPPPHDPIAMNVDAGIWNWMDVFGSHIMEKMTAAGLQGVSQQYRFDDYWPGTTETCIWKGVVGMLTEAARVNYASPVYIEPNELYTVGKGLGEYAKSINFPEPWPGGWWRLSDIVEYERVSMLAILETASKYREGLLRFRNQHTRKEVEKGRTQAPYYYILPQAQHDPSERVHIANLLHEHGIYLKKLTEDTYLQNRLFRKGDWVVPMAQPFRAFIKEVLEDQEFPERHYTPGGKLIKPYDITSWSLPLHKGVDVAEINQPAPGLENKLAALPLPVSHTCQAPAQGKGWILPANTNESYKLAFRALQQGLEVFRTQSAESGFPQGSFWLPDPGKLAKATDSLRVAPMVRTGPPKGETKRLQLPRIALMETHFHDMDAGWTRYVFDTYGIPFTVIRPGEVGQAKLEKNYDIIVLPNEHKSILEKGKYKSRSSYAVSTYPPEYTKGLGKKGMQKLLWFIENGGLVVSWGKSTALFEGTLQLRQDGQTQQEFSLPVRNAAGQYKEKGLYVPGAWVALDLKPRHPLTLGMPAQTGVFYRGGIVLKTQIPHFDMDRRVIGRFRKEETLLSGYAKGLAHIAQQPAMVWVKKGKGELVLYAFNPQFRGASDATFKLLFNALLLRA